jgi:cytochrome c oxidase subunit 2
MVGKVSVVTQREFEQWLEESAVTGEGMSPVDFGARLYSSKACITCHSVDGTAGTGPTFLGLYGSMDPLEDGREVRVDENYIRESILEPQAKIVRGYQPVMPTYQGVLNQREIDALIAYIKSLANGNQGGE